MPFIPPSQEADSRIPVQVDVAFDVLRWAGSIQNHSGNPENDRVLNPKEKSIYEAALEVVRLYLTGEMTFSETDETHLYEHPISPEPVSPVDVKKLPLDISDK